MAELPDGRVLVVGGYGGLTTGNLGIVDTNIFDPATSTWTRVADMHYAAVVSGPDRARRRPLRRDQRQLDERQHLGRHARGLRPDDGHVDAALERLDLAGPRGGVPVLVPGPERQRVHDRPAEDKSFLLNVDAQTWTQVGGSSGVVNGSSVMYRPGQDPLQRRRREPEHQHAGRQRRPR